MKRIKLVVVIGIVAIMLGITTQAWSVSGSSPAPGDPPDCLVNNPGKGAIRLDGIESVLFERLDVADYSLAVTLRLRRGSHQEFFRLNIPGNIPEGLNFDEIVPSDQELICMTLNPVDALTWGGEVAEELVGDFADEIITAFFGEAATEDPDPLRLVITRSSISGEQGIFACDSPDIVGADAELCKIPDTENKWSSLGEVVVYAVRSSKVN